MDIRKFLLALKSRRIDIYREGNRLRWKAPKGFKPTRDMIRELKKHKEEILRLLGKKSILIPGGKTTNTLIEGNCLTVLKQMPSDKVDVVVTDPPYGYSFMGKDWDKALPSIEIWKQCLRVLKPGAFAFIMASPRQDVLSRMIQMLEEAGFVIGFTSLYWTYATGFPKAQNISKAIDKKLGAKREVINERIMPDLRGGNYGQGKNEYEKIIIQDTIPATPKARQLDGSYAGFQPKPAVEIILVVMKPCNEKTYTKQALANGKGITWLDDCRIPYGDETLSIGNRHKQGRAEGYGFKQAWKQTGGMVWTPEKDWNQDIERQAHEKGRFPANIVISDDVLDGGYSRFFSLDAWAEDLPKKVQQNLPFFIVPKASKKEKDAGCENFPVREKDNTIDTAKGTMTKKDLQPNRNNHPTVKPLTLMSYLITMGSRPGDVVLDPFCGSGTTCIAAHKLQRRSIGIEKNPKYIRIARARLRPLVLESFRQKDTANDFSYEKSESPKKNCGQPQIKKEDYTMLVKRGHGDFPRIYRPYSPNELYGQEEIKQIIINCFKNGTIAHSYLFHGASGTGKTTCARIIGMGLLCEQGPTSMPCGKCQQCKRIMALSNMDFLELNNANFTGMDSMRTLRADFYCSPFMGRYKIFVFDECHRMTEATQSMMLKEVEDVIDGVYFIFCSTNPEKIIEPLRNRCMSVEFQPVKDNDIRRMLVDVCKWEGIIYQDGVLEPIIKEALGLPRNALFLLQKAVDSGKVQKSDNAS